MSNEHQIRALQEKIDHLSNDIRSFQHELYILQAQLNALKEDSPGIRQNKNASPYLLSKTNPSPVANDERSLENFIGLRFMHIIGIIVLVTGLSIGVKYAIDKELISEGMRIILAYAAGVILFILSGWLKKKYQVFSAILFSGSMASVYFTTYAAFVYYNFLPLTIAFAVMVALTIYTVIAAISYNRQEIAILGLIGAYGIPFLISANAERVDLFFSYILLINIGTVFISFRRSWKPMQYLALLITWSLFIGWTLVRYTSSWQLPGLMFMSAYYILFLISAIARRIIRSEVLSPGTIQQIIINNTALYISAILVFGDGGLEANLAETTGFSVLVAGGFALTAFILFPSEIVLQRLLAWQAIILVILFISIRWEGLVITLLWLMVAVLLFIWGAVAKKSWPRLASILLVGITLGKLIFFDSAAFSTVQKIISFLVIGVLLLVFSFYYQKYNLVDRKTGDK